MIGIIGAMQEEVEAIIEKMSDVHQEVHHTISFTTGKLASREVVVCQSGIGKVNATICTTTLLTQYDIQAILNIGTAGGLKLEQNVLDVVISDDVAHHDVDVRAFGYEIGQVPQCPVTFKADERLKQAAIQAAQDIQLNYHVGLILSGDQFIHQLLQKETMLNHFPNATCAEMEAAAIAQTCAFFKKPFVITRSLSDIAGKGENQIEFREYLIQASKNAASLCEGTISHL